MENKVLVLGYLSVLIIGFVFSLESNTELEQLYFKIFGKPYHEYKENSNLPYRNIISVPCLVGYFRLGARCYKEY